MANTLVLASIHRNRRLPLRGDMDGVNLDITPTDNKFKACFYTEDAKSYTLTSVHKFFINGQVANSITMGGRPDLSIEMFFDPVRLTWVVTDHNLNAATGGTGADQVSNLTIQAIVARLLPSGGPTGYLLGKVGNGDYAVGWVAPQLGNGSGAGPGNEIVVTPDPTTKEVTLDGSLGKAFRLVLTEANIKIKDPINFVGDTKITLTIVQDATAAYTLGGWGESFAFDDGLPPALATLPGAINLFTFTPTYAADAAKTWLTQVFPTKTSLGGFAKIVPIARIGSTFYLRLRAVDGSGAMENLQAGQSVIVLRNGKGGEATGNITHSAGGSFIVCAAPVAINPAADPRPVLDLLAVDYGEGPPRGANRPAFGKAILNFEGGDDIGAGMTVEIRDLRLTRGRNDDGDTRGIAQNGKCTMIVRNVEITDTNNGILTDNAGHMPLSIYDSVFDRNGVGTPNGQAGQGFNSSGYVHNLYTGHNRQVVTIERTSFLSSITGHNIKLRNAESYLNRVHSYNAAYGRELDHPNGGILEVTDSIFHKPGNAAQNNLIAIGNLFEVAANSQEGIDSNRTRRYRFTRCRFINEVDPTRDTSFLATKDPDVAVEFIDCEFVGAGTLAKNGGAGNDPNYAGMQITNGVYHMPGRPPIWTTTGGPVGPQGVIGRPASVALTALPA